MGEEVKDIIILEFLETIKDLRSRLKHYEETYSLDEPETSIINIQ